MTKRTSTAASSKEMVEVVTTGVVTDALNRQYRGLNAAFTLLHKLSNDLGEDSDHIGTVESIQWVLQGLAEDFDNCAGVTRLCARSVPDSILYR